MSPIPSYMWFATRWAEFRHGYVMYISFLLGFSNFSLIAYNFVPEIKDLVPLLIFVPAMLLTIVPIAVMVGRWHHKKNMPTDAAIAARHNYYRDRILPESKEVFFARHARDTANAMAWQMDVQRRQMAAINAIMKKLGMESEFVESDMKESADHVDKFKKWTSRHKAYLDGKDTSTL